MHSWVFLLSLLSHKRLRFYDNPCFRMWYPNGKRMLKVKAQHDGSNLRGWLDVYRQHVGRFLRIETV